MLSDRYKDALICAARLHDRQTRKGTEVAYLTHLMSVSALVMENGGDEEQGIAALLHDALEDQGNDYESEYLLEPRQGRPALKRDIELKFGARVLAIVIGCTDDEDFAKPAASERGSVEAWRVRKQAYIEHIEHTADVGLLRVSCADKLHNARTILLDLYEHGDAVWSRFRSGSRDNVVWYYQSLADAFSSQANTVGDHGLKRLCTELDRTVKLFGAERLAGVSEDGRGSWSDSERRVSAERAVELVAAHVANEAASRIRQGGLANVRDGWPDGAYRAGDEEPVWTAAVPNETPRVGAGRVICISKRTGDVLFDGNIGE